MLGGDQRRQLPARRARLLSRFARRGGGLWPPLRDILEDIGFITGKHKISLLLVLQGTLSVIVTPGVTPGDRLAVRDRALVRSRP